MFGKKKEVEVIVEQAPVVEEKKDAFVKANKTIVGPGITMVGEFSGSDPVLIEGTIRGTVKSDVNVHITKTGQLFGEGYADSFDVDGFINGNVDCKSNATFSNTGKMKGTLSTVRLKTDDGSFFEGTLNLKKPIAAVQEVAPAEEATEIPAEE